MNTVFAIILVCVVLATFIINNARVIRLEEHLQEVEKNMAVINSISGEAIEAFGKFVEELQKGVNTAKKESEDKNA